MSRGIFAFIRPPDGRTGKGVPFGVFVFEGLPDPDDTDVDVVYQSAREHPHPSAETLIW